MKQPKAQDAMPVVAVLAALAQERSSQPGTRLAETDPTGLRAGGIAGLIRLAASKAAFPGQAALPVAGPVAEGQKSRQAMHAAEIAMADSGGASHFPGGLPRIRGGNPRYCSVNMALCRFHRRSGSEGDPRRDGNHLP